MLSFRVHGALAAGVPAVIAPLGHRVAELAQLHRLPTLDPKRLTALEPADVPGAVRAAYAADLPAALAERQKLSTGFRSVLQEALAFAAATPLSRASTLRLTAPPTPATIAWRVSATSAPGTMQLPPARPSWTTRTRAWPESFRRRTTWPRAQTSRFAKRRSRPTCTSATTGCGKSEPCRG